MPQPPSPAVKASPRRRARPARPSRRPTRTRRATTHPERPRRGTRCHPRERARRGARAPRRLRDGTRPRGRTPRERRTRRRGEGGRRAKTASPSPPGRVPSRHPCSRCRVADARRRPCMRAVRPRGDRRARRRAGPRCPVRSPPSRGCTRRARTSCGPPPRRNQDIWRRQEAPRQNLLRPPDVLIRVNGSAGLRHGQSMRSCRTTTASRAAPTPMTEMRVPLISSSAST